MTMQALADALVYSIRCCIHDHLAQEADVERAIDAAALEIVHVILRPIQQPNEERTDT